MKADEIEMRPNLPVRVILLVRAMVQKRSQKVCRVRIAWSGRLRPSDLRLGKRAQDSLGGNVIKLEIFFSRAFPVSNIGFVPNFPQPGLYFCIAITPVQVVDKLEN